MPAIFGEDVCAPLERLKSEVAKAVLSVFWSHETLRDRTNEGLCQYSELKMQVLKGSRAREDGTGLREEIRLIDCCSEGLILQERENKRRRQ